ncbi:MAG: Glu-tRNA(Gln) amidotransferase subunit GatE [Promethearchaeota archaeon]
MTKIDYEKVGLLVGLEIHQQLDTKSKLFCNCPTLTREDDPHFVFLRQLRPTQSELGEIDPAALFEFQKGRVHIYETYDDTICLVEQDEEPPHPLDSEAVDIALELALLLGSQPVDEIQVMRKLVIDGSNTTGFQRTLVIAFGGTLEVEGKTIPIQTICLEEDAARKIGEENNQIRWRLDRLGIPLIEIATGPAMKNPEEVETVALRLGQILRVTGKVKRGLGTIRQDVNVSIRGGAIIEIKGVQKLNLISNVVEYEVQRQLTLLAIRDELRQRGIKTSKIKSKSHNVTALFKGCKSKVIKGALKRKEGIFALVLPGFANLVGRELQPGRRLGTEFADYARFWGDVKGLFHTDELPKYGITAEEVEKLRTRLKVSQEDAVILVAAKEEQAKEALKAVANRAKEALKGVPVETRGPLQDGTTKFARPRPGAARMYPETDVAPVTITEKRLKAIRKRLPELPEQKLQKFREVFGLSDELAHVMIRSLRIDLFEEIAIKHTEVAVTAAATLESTWRSLDRDGVEVEKIPEEQILRLFDRLAEGKFAKEAIPDIITWLARNSTKTIDDAIQALNLGGITREQLVEIVEKIVKENQGLITERRERALGPLMGLVMKQVRGRVDGKLVSELLNASIRRYITQDS